jgi:ectoine hydroxylase-related dioxygenase (phytanoyl-CoA dioxygenase family)
VISQLETDGFAVIPGPIADVELGSLSAAYDNAFERSAAEVKHGSTHSNSRLPDFVNRDAIFDRIYVHAPLLAAAARVIRAPFKLSAFHARTLHAHASEQKLHQDFAPLGDGFPMLGFIFMVDDFNAANGATRFVKRSQFMQDLAPLHDESCIVPACGPVGSMILFNGSVWHGFGANTTVKPRRSLQGALIRWDQPSAVDHARTIHPNVIARLSNAARDLLCLDSALGYGR